LCGQPGAGQATSAQWIQRGNAFHDVCVTSTPFGLPGSMYAGTPRSHTWALSEICREFTSKPSLLTLITNSTRPDSGLVVGSGQFGTPWERMQLL
jgi:hypothetical protein